MNLNWPKEFDDYFTLILMCLWVISYMHGVYVESDYTNKVFTCALKGVEFSQEENLTYDISIKNPTSYLQDPNNYYLKTNIDITEKNFKKSFFIMQLIYFFIIPALSLYYALFRFKSDMWQSKDLNTNLVTNIHRGEIENAK